MLQGTFDFNDNVKIDCNNAYMQMNVYIHEIAHLGLCKNTLFGILSFLLKQISEEPSMKMLYGIGKVLHDASERTNECYAMCSELIFVESQMPHLYYSFYEQFKKGQYYSKYQFHELDFLANLKMDVLKKSNLIDRIFALAMNVDVTKYTVETDWSSKEQLLHFFLSEGAVCWPDLRLKKIIQALRELIVIENNTDISDDEIINHSKIVVDEWTNKNVIAFLESLAGQFRRNNISTVLIERNIENLLNNGIQLDYNQEKDDDFERKIHEAIIPDCLTQNYTFEGLGNFIENIKQKNISIATLYDYGRDILLQLTDTMQGKSYSTVSNKEYVAHNQWYDECEIVFYFDDISVAKEYWKNVFKKRLFFQLKNTYSEFKQLIEPYCDSLKYTFLYRLNHGVFFMFVMGKDDDIFFTCQSMINVNYIREDIEAGIFRRVEFRDTDCVDGVFCKNPGDWRKFFNIILYASEIKNGEGSQQEFLQNIMLY